jgi:hypothetical protein
MHNIERYLSSLGQARTPPISGRFFAASCTSIHMGEPAAPSRPLEETTRDRVPLDWARTQNNLGLVLSTLGARENGTARLEEAVAAYRAALEEMTRMRVPLD